MAKILVVGGMVILVMALWFGLTSLLALGAQYVLGAFGVHVGFWVCFVALLVLSAIGRFFTRSDKS